MKPYLCLCLLFFVFLSCGLPNPLDLKENTNPVFNARVYSENLAITFEVPSSSFADNDPNFAGYNIYFDTVSTTADIEKNLIVDLERNIPSFSFNPSYSDETHTMIVDELNYERIENETNWEELQYEELERYSDYYFIIRSYNKANARDSKYDQEIFQVRPGFTTNNNLLVNNNSYRFVDVAFSLSNGYLFTEETTLWTSENPSVNFRDMVQAPSGPYHAFPLAMTNDVAIYIQTMTNNYAKLKVLSYSSDELRFNLHYQKGSTQLR